MNRNRTALRALPAVFLLAWAAGCGPRPAGAPAGFVVPPCDAPAELAFCGDVGGWDRQVAGLPGLGPRRVVAVPSYGADGLPFAAGEIAWTTDEWVFGWRDGRRLVLQMPRDRGLGEWAKGCFRARRWPLRQLGTKREFPESRLDAGGNVLVSPPVPGRFPWGRIVTSRQMQPAIKDFLRAQKLQTSLAGELLEIDTDWLKVGHVDEVVAFVPVVGDRLSVVGSSKNQKPTTDNRQPPSPPPTTDNRQPTTSFRLVLPDAEAGLKLLASVPADRAVFAAARGAQLAGRATAGGARFLEDKSRDFDKAKWKYVRIIAGQGAGLVAHVYKTEGHRLLIDQSWNLRGESPAAAVRAAREGRADSMPIWFDPPDATSRYLAVEESCLWLDGAGEEFPALVSAGELAGDRLLAAAARAVARRIDGPGGVGQVVAAGLGLEAREALRLPVLFYDDGEGASVVALAPNPINLFILEGEAVMLAPFGPREDPADESTDAFRRAWQRAFEGVGVRVRFLDGWDAIHRLDGGARCGTNIARKLPAAKRP